MAAEVMSITARPAHIHLITSDIRPEDAAECVAGGAPADITLAHMLQKSSFARTVFCDGNAMAMFGVIQDIKQVGIVWAITTRVVDRKPRAFWEASKRVMAHLAERYPLLTQCVDARYAKALRWLRRLGFTLDEQTHPCGPLGLPFHRATFVGKR